MSFEASNNRLDASASAFINMHKSENKNSKLNNTNNENETINYNQQNGIKQNGIKQDSIKQDSINEDVEEHHDALKWSLVAHDANTYGPVSVALELLTNFEPDGIFANTKMSISSIDNQLTLWVNSGSVHINGKECKLNDGHDIKEGDKLTIGDLTYIVAKNIVKANKIRKNELKNNNNNNNNDNIVSLISPNRTKNNSKKIRRHSRMKPLYNSDIPRRSLRNHSHSVIKHNVISFCPLCTGKFKMEITVKPLSMFESEIIEEDAFSDDFSPDDRGDNERLSRRSRHSRERSLSRSRSRNFKNKNIN